MGRLLTLAALSTPGNFRMRGKASCRKRCKEAGLPYRSTEGVVSKVTSWL